MIRKTCTHTEGGESKSGRKVDHHDCDYVDGRNALIHRATVVTRTRLMNERGSMIGFDAVFLDEMKRMSIESGLQAA